MSLNAVANIVFLMKIIVKHIVALVVVVVVAGQTGIKHIGIIVKHLRFTKKIYFCNRDGKRG